MCCGGQTPYAGQTSVQASKLREAAEQRPLALPPGLPPRLAEFIRRSCCFHPARRWQEAEAAAFLQGSLQQQQAQQQI